jgi:hypothetical protein
MIKNRQIIFPKVVYRTPPENAFMNVYFYFYSVVTTKRITIERVFSSGFSRDFRTEISCFVPILRKIPVEWTKKITKKATKNRHHEQSPPTWISLPVANFRINPQSSWVQMALLPMETEYRGSC